MTRLGRFGPSELTAATALLVLISGCFTPIETPPCTVSFAAAALAVPVAWALSELAFFALRRKGASSLGALLRTLPGALGVPLASLGTLALLGQTALCAARFLRALCEIVYPGATAAALALYLLPCAALLALLGMETLSRAGRVLLPLVLIAALVGLGSELGKYRVYRLFPLIDADSFGPGTVLGLFRYCPAMLLPLTVANGAQGLRHARSAARRGLWIGGGVGALAELSLCLAYRYAASETLSAPLLRLLIEINSRAAAVRLDRVVLSMWTMAGAYAAGLGVYGASLLSVDAFGVGDIRPVALLLAALCVTAAVCLAEAAALARVPLAALAYAPGLIAAFVLPAWGRRRAHAA